MNASRVCLGFVIASAIALASCAVGPQYKQPKPNIPEAWASGAQGVSAAGDKKSAVTWWGEFKDPTLESLVERATRSNLDVRQAVLRIDEARAQRGVAAAGFWPSVSLNASYQRQRLSESTQSGALITVAGSAFPNGALLANPFD